MNALSWLPVAGFRGSRPLVLAGAGALLYLVVLLIPLGGPWGPAIRFTVAAVMALLVIRAIVSEWTWEFLPARAPVGWLVAIGLGIAGALIAAGLPMLLSGGWQSTETNQLLAERWQLGADAGVNQAVVIGAVIAAPVAGELVFRGMIFAGLRNGLAQWLENKPAVLIAAVISGVAFALFHRTLWALDVALVLAAVLWGLIYHLTGSLLVTVGSYAAANAWLMWTLMHGPNQVAGGDGSTLAVIVVGPFAAIGVARLLGRMIAVGTETAG